MIPRASETTRFSAATARLVHALIFWNMVVGKVCIGMASLLIFGLPLPGSVLGQQSADLIEDIGWNDGSAYSGI